MNPMASSRLVYGFDPLCGWCFGFIPALEALTQQRPDIPIELRLGGLVTGERVRPYSEMENYIAGASSRLLAVTGQVLGEAFLGKLLKRSDVIASSIPPSAAILQVREKYPERALAFAHSVQAAHFRDGQDLNDLATYGPLLERLELDVTLELPAPDRPGPALQREFDETRALGISSFPTTLITQEGTTTTLPSEYQPPVFVAKVTNEFKRHSKVQL